MTDHICADFSTDELVQHLYAGQRDLRDGAVAEYIPELAGVDPDLFGVAITTVDGDQAVAGDADATVTLQSVSKPFTYALVLESRKPETIASYVGIEPSGDSFNSLALDHEGRPYNPMVNAGAIAMCGLAPGRSHVAKTDAILSNIAAFMGVEHVDVDEKTLQSEIQTAHRNFAIAHMLKGSGRLACPVDEVLDRYFRQCSVQVTARTLSVMAATLANHGTNPVTGKRVVSGRTARNVLSVMLTAGMYDYAGAWVHDVGIPAKSGVSGAIIAVVPGRFGIASVSPRLDRVGNSVRGIHLCEDLANDLHLHVLDQEGRYEHADSH
jgi:glutaminase